MNKLKFSYVVCIARVLWENRKAEIAIVVAVASIVDQIIKALH